MKKFKRIFASVLALCMLCLVPASALNTQATQPFYNTVRNNSYTMASNYRCNAADGYAYVQWDGLHSSGTTNVFFYVVNTPNGGMVTSYVQFALGNAKHFASSANLTKGYDLRAFNVNSCNDRVISGNWAP